jgi:glucose uptake protein
MFIIENYSTAVFFCFITMICWGSWANTQKLTASSWRFELFYWDYVWGIVLTSLLFGLTLGSAGENGRSFIADLTQADSENVISAIIGGIIFNAANILLVAAISIAGMSVAFPVGIGFALVIGVIVNYLDNPVGNKLVLFSGVGLVVVAIILNAYAYRRKAGNANSVSAKGLILSISAAILMGFFYRYVAASMFPDFKYPIAGMLSPYSSVFLFSIGILASNFVFNSLLMRRPFMGTPVSYSNYFSGKTKDHLLGVFGGMIWCIGMSFSIIASGKAGPAISYGLGQGATVVAALWGIFIWKEFKDSPKGTSNILVIMLLLYIVGLAAIILAR